MIRGSHFFENRDSIIKEWFEGKKTQTNHAAIIGKDKDKKLQMSICVCSFAFKDHADTSSAVQFNFRFGEFLIVLKFVLKLAFCKDTVGGQTAGISLRCHHKKMCLIGRHQSGDNVFRLSQVRRNDPTYRDCDLKVCGAI